MVLLSSLVGLSHIDTQLGKCQQACNLSIPRSYSVPETILGRSVKRASSLSTATRLCLLVRTIPPCHFSRSDSSSERCYRLYVSHRLQYFPEQQGKGIEHGSPGKSTLPSWPWEVWSVRAKSLAQCYSSLAPTTQRLNDFVQKGPVFLGR